MFTNLERAEPIIRVNAEDGPVAEPVAARGAYDRHAMARPVRAAAAVPVRMVEPLPEPEDEYDDLTEVQKENRFWEIINRFNWRNASDQRMNLGAAERTFNNFSRLDREVFRGLYTQKYNQMRDVMRDAIAAAGANEAHVVSHLIAMGRESFATVLEAPMLGDFFITSGECQNFPVPMAYTA